MSEDFYNVLFEASNEERLNIMRVLTEEKTSFSGLSRTLDITTQEVSRHFTRLVDAGLVTRDVEGYPCLTSYGLMVLKQLGSLEFTTLNREYFESHDAGGLPDKFVNRFGELAGMNYTDDIMVAIHNSVRIINEAEEYILNINMPYISSGFKAIRDAYERGIRGLFIHGANLKVPDEMKSIRDDVFSDDYLSYIRREGLLTERYNEVKFILYMNEHELALLSYPTLNGNYDYRGFTSKDPKALEWCRDLFQHYWDKGTPMIQ